MSQKRFLKKRENKRYTCKEREREKEEEIGKRKNERERGKVIEERT